MMVGLFCMCGFVGGSCSTDRVTCFSFEVDCGLARTNVGSGTTGNFACSPTCHTKLWQATAYFFLDNLTIAGAIGDGFPPTYKIHTHTPHACVACEDGYKLTTHKCNLPKKINR